jgi:hypothetical protein
MLENQHRPSVKETNVPRQSAYPWWAGCLVLALVSVPSRAEEKAAPAGFRRLTLAQYRDRMKAGWVGQAGGVSFGAPTEFRCKHEPDPGKVFSFTEYNFPKLLAASEKVAREVVQKAGGRIEKDAGGEEVFLIPLQEPKPSALEKSWEPGPISKPQVQRGRTEEDHRALTGFLVMGH